MNPDAPLEIMNFTGKIIGKAVFEGIPISAKFSRLFMKEMTDQDLVLEDLKDFDE